MADKVAKIVDQIKDLSVVEAFELKKALEEEFGVQAAAPMAMMAGMMPAAAAAEPVEEKTEFDVILSDFGADKINVIKVVKGITGLGLKEAKELVESVSGGAKPIVEAASKEKAQDVLKQLTDAGAKAEMK